MLSELEQLQEKLGKLLKQYAALQADHSRLLQIKQRQDDLCSKQQLEIAELQKKLQVQALTDTNITEGCVPKEDLKKYLEQVIGEIDKSLAMLK